MTRTNAIGETLSKHDEHEDCPPVGSDEETTHCETCDGTGRVAETIDVDVAGHNRAGSYGVTVTCDACGGEGRIPIEEEAEKRAAIARTTGENQ